MRKKAPSAPKSVPYAAAASAAESARDKLLPLLKRHYKAIGIALLALLVLTQLSRCAGGGKEDKLLDQLRGSWSMQTQVYGDAATQVNRPWDIYIFEHSIQLAGADISLLFGVAGEGALSGESGKLIQSQLTQIMAELNKNPLKVKVGIDTDTGGKKSWGSQLQAQLDKVSTSGKFSVQISTLKLSAGAVNDFKK